MRVSICRIHGISFNKIIPVIISYSSIIIFLILLPLNLKDAGNHIPYTHFFQESFLFNDIFTISRLLRASCAISSGTKPRPSSFFTSGSIWSVVATSVSGSNSIPFYRIIHYRTEMSLFPCQDISKDNSLTPLMIIPDFPMQ